MQATGAAPLASFPVTWTWVQQYGVLHATFELPVKTIIIEQHFFLFAILIASWQFYKRALFCLSCSKKVREALCKHLWACWDSFWCLLTADMNDCGVLLIIFSSQFCLTKYIANTIGKLLQLIRSFSFLLKYFLDGLGQSNGDFFSNCSFLKKKKCSCICI